MVVRARRIHFVRHTLATKDVSSVRHNCPFIDDNRTKSNEIHTAISSTLLTAILQTICLLRTSQHIINNSVQGHRLSQAEKSAANPRDSSSSSGCC